MAMVSFAAVIRVVTQRSSPLTAVSGEACYVTTLITAAKETTIAKASKDLLISPQCERLFPFIAD